MSPSYQTIRAGKNGLIKAWTKGVPFEKTSRLQLENAASLPIIYKWIAVMPDVHTGIGATVGSVIPTRGAIIPAAVGVDIGCGMMAVQTSLRAEDLPENLHEVRTAIEEAVPHGRTHGGGARDEGAWGEPDNEIIELWNAELKAGFERIKKSHPITARANHVTHLGTLGTGNHFIEICLDESNGVWFMLHSGSRGVGNRIGTHFIALAKKDMRRHLADLPDRDLAYFQEGSRYFEDYVYAVEWAQKFARLNRETMMRRMMRAVANCRGIPPFSADAVAVNCHHNYVSREKHYGERVFVTRKGAVSARRGEYGIIPGSMGARSFIVRGLGNAESFHSCSHGAGRVMSRREAKKRFTQADHIAAVRGVECRVDEDVIDETPGAYKNIDDVMEAQKDLVEIVHTLKQIVCVKG